MHEVSIKLELITRNLRKRPYKTCYQVCGVTKKGTHFYKYAHDKFQAVLMAKYYGMRDAVITKIRG